MVKGQDCRVFINSHNEGLNKKEKDRAGKYLAGQSVEGKLMPNDEQLEQVVLGGLLLSSSEIHSVMDLLKEDLFYKEQHQLIFKAVKTLFDSNMPVDLITVVRQLRQDGNLDNIGGAYVISQLTNRVASAANLEYHIRLLTELAIRRNLILSSSLTLNDAYAGQIDVFELLDKTETEFDKISDLIVNGTVSDMKNIVEITVEEIKQTRLNEGVIGKQTGYLDMDARLLGLQKKRLYILAARPGAGKTTLGLNIIKNAAFLSNAKILMFSLEMTKEELAKKLLSDISEIQFENIKKGELSEEQWVRLKEAQQSLAKLNVFIEDKAGLTAQQIRTIARKYKRKEEIELVVIDHLQKIHTGVMGQNREQEVNAIADTLKNMAKDLDLPVLALCQLSREVDKRPDKVPQLSDLRESGGIEQEADVVMFIFRPAMYGITHDAEGNDVSQQAKIIIAKDRAGKIGDFNLRFNGELSRFENLGGDEKRSYSTSTPYSNVPSYETKAEMRQGVDDIGSVDNISANTGFLENKEGDIPF